MKNYLKFYFKLFFETLLLLFQLFGCLIRFSENLIYLIWPFLFFCVFSSLLVTVIFAKVPKVYDFFKKWSYVIAVAYLLAINILGCLRPEYNFLNGKIEFVLSMSWCLLGVSATIMVVFRQQLGEAIKILKEYQELKSDINDSNYKSLRGLIKRLPVLFIGFTATSIIADLIALVLYCTCQINWFIYFTIYLSFVFGIINFLLFVLYFFIDFFDDCTSL